MHYTIELDDITASTAKFVAGEIECEPEPKRTLTTTLQGILLAADPAKIEATTAEMAALTRAELDLQLTWVTLKVETAAATSRAVSPATRLELWLVNAEYTQRSIPPVFRRLPHPNDDDPDQIADLFAVDLHWLVARYPQQPLLLTRWKGLFQPTRFHRASDWISTDYPRNAMHWFCKGLGLTDDQHREMHFIKRDGIRKEFDRLTAEREAARINLSTAYHARAQDVRYRTDDHKATISRRLEIWFAGSLANWRPQRTAELYCALTGEPITRQLAAKVIAQVHRDLPESKPRTRRRGPKIRNSDR
jgi:hypothetical protein